MAVRTQINLSEALARNVQTGSVVEHDGMIEFAEYVARHSAATGPRSFNHMTKVVATKDELSLVRIPLTEETAERYTVDKYTDLVAVLKDVTGSE